MKNNKRILSMLLACCLVLSTLPIPVLAVEDGETENTTTVNEPPLFELEQDTGENQKGETETADPPISSPEPGNGLPLDDAETEIVPPKEEEDSTPASETTSTELEQNPGVSSKEEPETTEPPVTPTEPIDVPSLDEDDTETEIVPPEEEENVPSVSKDTPLEPEQKAEDNAEDAGSAPLWEIPESVKTSQDSEWVERFTHMSDGVLRAKPSPSIKPDFLTDNDSATVQSLDAGETVPDSTEEAELATVSSRASTSNSSYFYSQLSPMAKTVYNTILSTANRSKLKNGQKIFVWESDAFMFRPIEENPETGETNADNWNHDYEYWWNNILPVAWSHLDALQDAYAILYMDRPDIFWVGCIEYFWGVSVLEDNGSWRECDLNDPEDGYQGGRTYKANAWVKFDLLPPWSSGQSISSGEATVSSRISAIVEQIDTNASRFQQVLQIHDWLTKNNTYNVSALSGSNTDGDIPWEALSALSSGHSPVCAGYAKAFRLLCDKLGIPCVMIPGEGKSGGSSESHMWNYVQMEDGYWYAVDVTWDDPTGSGETESGYENHDYFLVGSRTTIGDSSFSGSHIADSLKKIDGSSFRFPSLSNNAYTYYTITFDSRGGSKVAEQLVTRNDKIKEPDKPVREYFTFNGWYVDAECKHPFDFNLTVSESLTLYAKWTPSIHNFSYKFSNSSASFGYPKNYKFSEIPFQLIFGNGPLEKRYYSEYTKTLWGGNCYGMSSTSGLFFKNGNNISPADFREGAKVPYDLDVKDKHNRWTLKSSGVNFGITSEDINRKVTLTDIIEAMQVSQLDKDIQDKLYENGWSWSADLGDLVKAVENFQANLDAPVVLCLRGSPGSHAILGYGVTVVDGKKRLLVYDNNYPGVEKYIELQTSRNGKYTGWTYNPGNSVDVTQVYSSKKQNRIAYLTYDDYSALWPKKYRAGESKEAANMALLTINANEASIYDEDDVLIATVRNGELNTAYDDIYEMVLFDVNADGESTNRPGLLVWIPSDMLYKVVNEDKTIDKFEVGMAHDHQSALVETTNDTVTFAVNDDKKINYVSLPDAECTYNITLESNLSDTYQIVKLNGTVTDEPVTVMQTDTEIYVEGIPDEDSSDLTINEDGEDIANPGDKLSTGMPDVSVDDTVTITLNFNDGSPDRKQRIQKGTALGQLNDPFHEHYTFEGWYADAAYTSAYDFTSIVTEDITLYAKWNKEGYHAVTFVTSAGSTVPSQSVAEGEKATRPADPTRKGYVFDGWYTDAAYTTAYDFDSVVNKDITLYAKWNPNPAELHTVTFVTSEGSTVPDQSVADGEKATRPTDPTREGYVFNGWYTDDACTSVYDFDSVVNDDLTLYAKWKKAGTHTVTFVTSGGTTVPDQSVADGEKATRPTEPTRDGYRFDGWYTDSACTSVYDFATPVTADITLYANWTKNNVWYPSSGGGGGGGSSQSYSITANSADNGSVSLSVKTAQQGQTVTISVTPDDGFELKELLVKDAKDKEISTTKTKDGKYTFVMPASKVSVTSRFVAVEKKPEEDKPTDTPEPKPEPKPDDKPAEQPSIPFADVPANAYYAEAVVWAVEKDITRGTTETTFDPDCSCTRAQIVTFLWREAGSPTPTRTDNPFIDVPSNAYYYDAVRWAVEQKITTGKSTTTFDPDATVTRGQTVTFLHRAAGEPKTSVANPFADIAADAFYSAAVNWAAEQEITQGTTDTTFSPDASCTRGQIVTFLYRYSKIKKS